MRLRWNLIQFNVTTSDRSRKDKRGEGSPVQAVETGVSLQQTKDGRSSSASERRCHSCHQDGVQTSQLQNYETGNTPRCKALTCGPDGAVLGGNTSTRGETHGPFLLVFLYSAQMSLLQPQTHRQRTASEAIPREEPCTGQHLTESPLRPQPCDQNTERARRC